MYVSCPTFIINGSHDVFKIDMSLFMEVVIVKKKKRTYQKRIIEIEGFMKSKEPEKENNETIRNKKMPELKYKFGYRTWNKKGVIMNFNNAKAIKLIIDGVDVQNRDFKKLIFQSRYSGFRYVQAIRIKEDDIPEETHILEFPLDMLLQHNVTLMYRVIGSMDTWVYVLSCGGKPGIKQDGMKYVRNLKKNR